MKKEAEQFTDYVKRFIVEHNIADIVEIGSDVQMNIARKLSPICDIYYSVNFPEYNSILKKRNKKTPENVFWIDGDATELSKVIEHADLILLHNVLIDGNKGKDISAVKRISDIYESERLKQKYNVDATKAELASNFRIAERKAYSNFVAVANPGFIIQMGISSKSSDFEKMLIETIGIPYKNISQRLLREEDSPIISPVYIIENSPNSDLRKNIDFNLYVNTLNRNKNGI
jgi:hypothetical protein